MLVHICGKDGQETLVKISGDIDLSTADDLRSALQALHRTGACRVAIDLQDIGILDTSGIKVLLNANDTFQAAGGALRLLHVPRHTQRVLHILKLDKQLVPS